MASKDHSQKTDDVKKQQICSATITQVQNLSPTVKGLCLQVHQDGLTFKPGQWLDFFIPGMEEMTGFSMSSSPYKLESEGQLDLAVKSSADPPARWVHTQCKEGDKVQIRIGGDFFYPPSQPHPPHSLLLIAGGVGINPLVSMMRYLVDVEASHGRIPESVKLLFSAKTEDELIYRNSIEQMCQDSSFMDYHFFVTAWQSSPPNVSHTNISYKRMDKSILQAALLSAGHPSRVLCYICGPGPMIDDTKNMLTQLGLSQAQMMYEKWW